MNKNFVGPFRAKLGSWGFGKRTFDLKRNWAGT